MVATWDNEKYEIFLLATFLLSNLLSGRSLFSHREHRRCCARRAMRASRAIAARDEPHPGKLTGSELSAKVNKQITPFLF